MPRPILAPGLTTGDELILYGERDFIGVESRGDDPRGINAAAAWTRRAKASAIVEHDEEGVHNTPRIPRGLCSLRYNESTFQYEVQGGSHLRGWLYSDDPSIYTVTTIADGVFDLDLGIAMPSASFGIIDLSRRERRGAVGGDPFWTWVACYGNAASTTQIRITRRTGEAHITNGYDGPCAFLLCG